MTALDERVAPTLSRRDRLVVHFESAYTQDLMARLLLAYVPGGSDAFDELVEEFDRAYVEATAGR